MTISTEKIEIYRQGLQRRLSRPLTKIEEIALAKAFIEAEQIAQMLVNKYGAKRVLLFGSLARRRPLRPDSDIDLAVEGMSPEAYYKIVGDLQTTSGRVIDLIRLENVRPATRKIILLEGISLGDDGLREHPPSDN